MQQNLTMFLQQNLSWGRVQAIASNSSRLPLSLKRSTQRFKFFFLISCFLQLFLQTFTLLKKGDASVLLLHVCADINSTMMASSKRQSLSQDSAIQTVILRVPSPDQVFSSGQNVLSTKSMRFPERQVLRELKFTELIYTKIQKQQYKLMLYQTHRIHQLNVCILKHQNM